MVNYFKRKNINTKRQIELDIAKGIAVFCMIAVHVQSTFAVTKIIHTKFGGIIEFLGTLPAAPVFMFLLGTGLVYSKNTDSDNNIKRGFRILFLGYLLNILRTGLTFIPLIVKNKGLDIPSTLFGSIANIDILQFAGLALVFMGFLKKRNVSLFSMSFITIAFSLINIKLLKFKYTNYFYSAITGLIWGSSEWSAFPFLTWIFYPVAGYVFGTLLIKTTNKNKFYLVMFFISTIVLIACILASYILSLDTGLLTEYGYYHHNLYSNILYTSFVVVWISILYMITKFLPKKIKITLKRWSSNVTEIYFIHWILISSMIPFIGYRKLGILPYIAIFIIIVFLSDIIAYCYKKK